MNRLHWALDNQQSGVHDVIGSWDAIIELYGLLMEQPEQFTFVRICDLDGIDLRVWQKDGTDNDLPRL